MLRALVCVSKSPVPCPALTKQGNGGTQRVDAVGSGVQGHPRLHSRLCGQPGLHKTMSENKMKSTAMSPSGTIFQAQCWFHIIKPSIVCQVLLRGARPRTLGLSGDPQSAVERGVSSGPSITGRRGSRWHGRGGDRPLGGEGSQSPGEEPRGARAIFSDCSSGRLIAQARPLPGSHGNTGYRCVPVSPSAAANPGSQPGKAPGLSELCSPGVARALSGPRRWSCPMCTELSPLPSCSGATWD